MWIEQICGKDIAEMQFKTYEACFNEVEEVETELCECGEHEAKYIVKDEFMKCWNNNLCEECFKEEIEEYDKEGTKYTVRLNKGGLKNEN